MLSMPVSAASQQSRTTPYQYEKRVPQSPATPGPRMRDANSISATTMLTGCAHSIAGNLDATARQHSCDPVQPRLADTTSDESLLASASTWMGFFELGRRAARRLLRSRPRRTRGCTVSIRTLHTLRAVRKHNVHDLGNEHGRTAIKDTVEMYSLH
jgi:hypothetical protein